MNQNLRCVEIDFIKQLSSNGLLKSCTTTSLLKGSSTVNLDSLSHLMTTMLSIPSTTLGERLFSSATEIEDLGIFNDKAVKGRYLVGWRCLCCFSFFPQLSIASKWLWLEISETFLFLFTLVFICLDSLSKSNARVQVFFLILYFICLCAFITRSLISLKNRPHFHLRSPSSMSTFTVLNQDSTVALLWRISMPLLSLLFIIGVHSAKKGTHLTINSCKYDSS
ncbi:uncharacterized protein LOC126553160 [Aphis gossypii]|uniref:uncharacterized protein LOC126553160 n=1 Tax=Aphis gossypii TaxID=80765 RepID=UPI002158FDD1|nr:uncharacterized protein LOC126553160 [Aphis gossypii]